MLLEAITLPVTLELDAKSKALIAALQRMGTETATTTDRLPASNADALTPPAHGEYWTGQGGHYICTLPALMGVPARHLIAGAEEATNLTFGPDTEIKGADSHIDGPANTAALLTSGEDHPAANYCKAYSADGHTDFFLPARLDMVMTHICAKSIFNTEGYYWTSTQNSRSSAFVQDFEFGFSSWYYKDYGRRVRAFRWILT